jgi:hypothetical protein
MQGISKPDDQSFFHCSFTLQPAPDG